MPPRVANTHRTRPSPVTVKGSGASYNVALRELLHEVLIKMIVQKSFFDVQGLDTGLKMDSEFAKKRCRRTQTIHL
jgi:hypothetical protein